jgi:hypothetical protein
MSSLTPPYRVRARATAGASLPTTSTDHERWLRRRPADEFCRDPTATEIWTAARGGWQSRQPKKSGTARAG